MDRCVVQCEATGIYAMRLPGRPAAFITLDINKATSFEDTPMLRDWFVRNYKFELKFIKV